MFFWCITCTSCTLLGRIAFCKSTSTIQVVHTQTFSSACQLIFTTTRAQHYAAQYGNYQHRLFPIGSIINCHTGIVINTYIVFRLLIFSCKAVYINFAQSLNSVYIVDVMITRTQKFSSNSIDIALTKQFHRLRHQKLSTIFSHATKFFMGSYIPVHIISKLVS